MDSNGKHMNVAELAEAIRVKSTAIRIMDNRIGRQERMATMGQVRYDPGLLKNPDIIEALAFAAQDADPNTRELAQEILREAQAKKEAEGQQGQQG